MFIISDGVSAHAQALVLQRKPTEVGLQAELHCGIASMKNQFKRADRVGARIALVIGDAEAQSNTVGIRSLLRDDNAQTKHAEQQTIIQNDAVNTVTNLLESL